MLQNYIFTSESVTEGHPDKIADQISDAIVDSFLRKDPKARVACEVMVAGGLVVLAGEISSTAQVDPHDLEKIARQRIQDIGYDDESKGLDARKCEVRVVINGQSPEIAQGVNEGEGTFKEQGAGDQGIMFGYAVNETQEQMPLTIDLAHKLSYKLSEVRKSGILPLLGPDGKTQVSVQYENGQVKRISTIVVSSQHHKDFPLNDLQEALREEVIKKVIPSQWMDEKTKLYINPTGSFIIGGPQGDCGLTGRKIIVDTYGGHGAHGGGAFSGKDPSKVDRSATYASRWVAKHLVAAGLTEKALVQISYAIGVAHPVSFLVETFGTEKVDPSRLHKVIGDIFDMRPRMIIEELELQRPIYSETASYGHFGRTSPSGFTWEKLTQLDKIKSYF